MKILFVTTKNPTAQGDLLEVSILHGLRSLLGENCVDHPRKKVMYHDWSDVSKEELHGRGFTLYTRPLDDIQNRELKDFDVVLYGVTNAYGEQEDEALNKLAPRKWFLDGHDLYGYAPRMIEHSGESVIGVQKTPCFKRELVEEMQDAFPTGFGIPEYQIRDIELKRKHQQYQKTVPDGAMFRQVRDMGGRGHHKFHNETDYYNDLASSWFGLTCKKGGWDCLRHYEIIAAGTLLLFRDYDKKPSLCSPQQLPCFSYSSQDELEDIMRRLVSNGKASDEYKAMLYEQRQWLRSTATTVARARKILETLNARSD